MKRFKIANGKVVVTAAWTGVKTFWNGQETPAEKVRVVVGKAQPGWWTTGLEGRERNAVKVTYGREVFYLDNEAHGPGTRAGAAWDKVTLGLGSPKYGHRSLPVEREVTP